MQVTHMMLACAQEKMQGAAIMSSSKTMAEAAAMASAAAASVNATQWRSLHKGLERLSEAYDEMVARAEGWVQRAHEMEELAGDLRTPSCAHQNRS